MKKRVLIIGPFIDFGGRELETSFIAESIESKFNVSVFSTLNISRNSQIHEFTKKSKISSINECLYKRFFWLKIFSYLTFLKYGKDKLPWFYIKNKISRKLINVEEKINIIIDELISNHDLILICAQLSSNYNKQIVETAKKNNKKIIFRTTGVNYADNIQKFNWISDVSVFIHHSKNNSNNLSVYYNHFSKIIDQCAFYEKDLLSLPLVFKIPQNFMTIARIEKNKNIDIIIKGFLKNSEKNDKLYVVGDGKELTKLQKDTLDDRVIFTGFLKNSELVTYMRNIDCVIISYYEFETGPLTGVEAMASGKMLISSKTGAMQERLCSDVVEWHNNTVESVCESIKKVKKLSLHEVKSKSEKIRNLYIQNHLKTKISSMYLNLIDEELSSK